MTKNTKAHTAVLGANFIFGANYAVVKYITPSFLHPFALNVVRILVSLGFSGSCFFLNRPK
jgi:hypothetical protein